MKQSEKMRVLRASVPATESTWIVCIQAIPLHGDGRTRVDSYHDTHEEAFTCARAIIASHEDGVIPFVLVCKIHNQNGDE